MGRQRGWNVLIVIVIGTVAHAAEPQPAEPPLDPLQWAVVNSLRHPERKSPDELLEAAVRSAAVEALEPTLEFLDLFDQALAAEADPEATLAKLGDSVPVGELNRLRRFLAAAAPPDDAAAIAKLIELLRTVSDSRRTDPARLVRAAADLQSGLSYRRPGKHSPGRGVGQGRPRLRNRLFPLRGSAGRGASASNQNHRIESPRRA